MGSKGENRPCIFLVDDDDDARRIMRQNLTRYGYHVSLALDEDDALERVGGGHLQADLVLVNLVGKSTDEVLNIGRRIRKHAKYDGHTPLVVIADKYGPDLEGKNVNVSDNDWITYPEDPEQLKNLLSRLLPQLSA